MLGDREIAGVLAHEIGRIRIGDSFSFGLAEGLVRIAAALSWLGLSIVLISAPAYLFYNYTPPLLAIVALVSGLTLIIVLRLALSRLRELAVYMEAAQLLGDPHPLASARSKLNQVERSLLEWMLLSYQPATQEYWLSSYPHTEEFIRRFLDLESRPQYYSYLDWIEARTYNYNWLSAPLQNCVPTRRFT